MANDVVAHVRSDDEFLAAFEAGALSDDEFHHRDHLRLTWLALQRWGEDQGCAWVVAGIRRFAASKGAVGKFDEALTRRWVERVWIAVRRAPLDETFTAFLERNPALRDKRTDEPGAINGQRGVLS
jgi:hypothetical protein